MNHLPYVMDIRFSKQIKTNTKFLTVGVTFLVLVCNLFPPLNNIFQKSI